MRLLSPHFRTAHLGLLAMLTVVGLWCHASAQEQATTTRSRRFTEPIFRVPGRRAQSRAAATTNPQPGAVTAPQTATPAPSAATTQNQNAAAVPPLTVEGQGQPAADEHPLMPAIRLANQGLAHIDRDIRGYSCTLYKRERIDGVLGDQTAMYLKVRHNPFSVYMYFLTPDGVRGRECLYVNNPNVQKNKLVAHEGGGLIGKMTVHLDPTGMLAMRGQRYPITEVGIRTLTAKLLEVAKQDLNHGECEVKFFKGAKVNGRVCTCLQVVHPEKRPYFRFHLAHVFIDDELQIPIRYAAYLWPTTPGGKPVLDEEYTYLNLKINPGLTDVDFSDRNPDYHF